jgi:ribonuclease E
MFSPTVTLRSGGYIVINQTEALVSIDVNSGRSTREHHIEDTALKTNLEAAEEVARQLRLRDLAGLIVIDFIDMDEKRNNRAVERKMSDCLRQDRARIQVGRISHFGLLEMSRQRIRASVLESSTEPCPTCGGTGHVRSVSSVALQLLRSLEEQLMKSGTHNYSVRTRTDVALYVLNHKRGHLRDLEEAFQVTLAVIADPTVSGQQSFIIERGEQVHTAEAAKALLAARVAAQPVEVEEFDDEEEFFEEEVEAEAENGEAADTETAEARNEGDEGPRRRRRRRRGRGRGEGRDAAQASSANGEEAVAGEEGQAETSEDGEDESEAGTARADQENGERRPRRRGRRGGRRRRGNGPEDGLAGSIADELGPTSAPEAASAVADFDGSSSVSAPSLTESEPASQPVEPQPATFVQPETIETVTASTAPAAPAEEAAPEADRAAAPRRSTVREKVSFLSSAQAEPAPSVSESVAEQMAAPEPAPAAPAPAPTAEAAPRKAGWWSRRFGSGE